MENMFLSDGRLIIVKSTEDYSGCVVDANVQNKTFNFLGGENPNTVVYYGEYKYFEVDSQKGKKWFVIKDDDRSRFVAIPAEFVRSERDDS